MSRIKNLKTEENVPTYEILRTSRSPESAALSPAPPGKQKTGL